MRRSFEPGVMSTLLTNEGRDDVVVLLDRAVGARREGREGRHHDLWFVNKDGFWKRQEREAAAKAAKEEKVVEA